MTLNGKCAVVTGAGAGIGASVAAKLASLGATVVLAGRTRSSLEAVAKKIAQNGGKAEIFVCDVSNLESVDALAQFVRQKFEGLEVLVNNAGVRGVPGPLHELPPDSWDAVMNTNLRGVFYCIRSLAPLMIQAKSGHIINISSLAGKNALPGGAAYAASKWALNGLSYSVAEELRGFNVRVSVICPGSVHTDFSPHTGKSPDKMLQPEDIAHAVEMVVTQAPQSFVSEILLRPAQKP
ncbi:MAG: SDR family NAD(P)-dependent oxidoreductase [Terriglobales bacterium]|jgi:3-oxoacyl-[acyl-carrier protein] reductase